MHRGGNECSGDKNMLFIGRSDCQCSLPIFTDLVKAIVFCFECDFLALPRGFLFYISVRYAPSKGKQVIQVPFLFDYQAE